MRTGSLKPSPQKDLQIQVLKERCQRLEEQVESLVDEVSGYQDFVSDIRSAIRELRDSDCKQAARMLTEALLTLQGD